MYRVTFIVMLCMSVAAITARVVGTTDYNTFATLITNPDGTRCGQPCIFGIRPGMTLSQATDLLKHHILTNQHRRNPQSSPGSIWQEFIGPGGTIYLSVDPVQQTITCSGVWLVPTPSPSGNSPLTILAQDIRLADVINLWDKPDSVQPEDPYLSEVYYQKKAVMIGVKSNNIRRLSLQDTIYFVGVSGITECYFPSEVETHWLGFTRFQRYLSAIRR